jgi:uncharacterized protein YecT (DUF1311 family)
MRRALKPTLIALCGVLASALSAPTPVHGEEDNRCGDLETTLQRQQCFQNSLKEVEGEISKLMAQLQQTYKSKKADRAAKDLSDDAMRWNSFASQHCAMLARRFDGGSEAAVAVKVCSFRLAVQRKDELKLLLADAAL